MEKESSFSKELAFILFIIVLFIVIVVGFLYFTDNQKLKELLPSLFDSAKTEVKTITEIAK